MADDLKLAFIKKDYRIFTTKKKVILYFFAIVLLIFFVFNTIFYNLYSANIKQIIEKENKSSLERTCEHVDLILKKLENTSDILLNNPAVQSQAQMGFHNAAEDYLTYSQLITYMQSIVHAVEGASSIDLYLDGTGMLISSDYGLFSKLEREEREYFRQLQTGLDNVGLSTDYRKKLTFLPDRNYEQLTLLRPLYAFSTGTRAGVVAISMDKYVLRSILQGGGDTSSVILNEAGEIVVGAFSDSGGAAAAGELTALPDGGSGVRFRKLEGVENIFVYHTSPYSNWRFVSFTPLDSSMRQMSELRDYILLLFLLMNIISAAVFIILLYGKIYNKLDRLILSMREVERGNFNVSIEHGEPDEFGYMFTSFNSMAERIRSLFGELYQQKLLQKDAELKLLQSKINPHFIYNIFDNMNWLIQLKRYDELETLVDSVSDYYKKSLNAGKDFITVANTVEQLKSYSDIQRIRFRNRFTCSFEFDEDIMDQRILNFMLQPLLENAICHGIEPKTESSSIVLKGNRRGNEIVFSVEDDGIGINSELLENIDDYLNSERSGTDSYFALANIHKRIKLYYGEKYGLAIKSQQTVGTRVTVTIPANPVFAPEGIIC